MPKCHARPGHTRYRRDHPLRIDHPSGAEDRQTEGTPPGETPDIDSVYLTLALGLKPPSRFAASPHNAGGPILGLDPPKSQTEDHLVRRIARKHKNGNRKETTLGQAAWFRSRQKPGSEEPDSQGTTGPISPESPIRWSSSCGKGGGNPHTDLPPRIVP